MRITRLCAVSAAVSLALPLANACAPKPGDPMADAQHALADLPARYQGADLKNGAELFSLCRTCHTAISGGADMTGPNLHGVFGRKVASKPGYAYSDALKAFGQAGDKTWTADLIDQWLANPRTFVPGTKMSFPGLPDADNRRDVIAYLKVISTAP